VLAYILSLQEHSPPDDAGAMHRRFRVGLADMRRQAEESGIDTGDIRLASFALVAFADETAISAVPAYRGKWPFLQFEYFGTHHAGDEFFDDLRKIQGGGSASARWRDPAKAGLLELYYLCLFLGFRGRWAASAPQEVQHDLDEVRKYVRSKPVGPLSPHGTPRKGICPAGPREGQGWKWAGIAVYLALLFALALFAAYWLRLA
jgi:type VI secretion system protein ImpK